jgi:CrcB protein
MTYLLVALGSAVGGMARYGVSGLVARSFGSVFPWGTLIVNVVGSALIGFLAASAAPGARWLLSPDARALLMIGFCGGFTTFSSFSLETLNLLRDGEWLWAGANVVFSVVLCLVFVWLGYAAGAGLNR